MNEYHVYIVCGVAFIGVMSAIRFAFKETSRYQEKYFSAMDSEKETYLSLMEIIESKSGALVEKDALLRNAAIHLQKSGNADNFALGEEIEAYLSSHGGSNE